MMIKFAADHWIGFNDFACKFLAAFVLLTDLSLLTLQLYMHFCC